MESMKIVSIAALLLFILLQAGCCYLRLEVDLLQQTWTGAFKALLLGGSPSNWSGWKRLWYSLPLVGTVPQVWELYYRRRLLQDNTIFCAGLIYGHYRVTVPVVLAILVGVLTGVFVLYRTLLSALRPSKPLSRSLANSDDPSGSLRIVKDLSRSLRIVKDLSHSLWIVADPSHSLQIVKDLSRSLWIVADPSHSLQIVEDPSHSLQIAEDPSHSLQIAESPSHSLQIAKDPSQSPRIGPSHRSAVTFMVLLAVWCGYWLLRALNSCRRWGCGLVDALRTLCLPQGSLLDLKTALQHHWMGGPLPSPDPSKSYRPVYMVGYFVKSYRETGDTEEEKDKKKEAKQKEKEAKQKEKEAKQKEKEAKQKEKEAKKKEKEAKKKEKEAKKKEKEVKKKEKEAKEEEKEAKEEEEEAKEEEKEAKKEEKEAKKEEKEAKKEEKEAKKEEKEAKKEEKEAKKEEKEAKKEEKEAKKEEKEAKEEEKEAKKEEKKVAEGQERTLEERKGRLQRVLRGVARFLGKVLLHLLIIVLATASLACLVVTTALAAPFFFVGYLIHPLTRFLTEVTLILFCLILAACFVLLFPLTAVVCMLYRTLYPEQYVACLAEFDKLLLLADQHGWEEGLKLYLEESRQDRS